MARPRKQSGDKRTCKIVVWTTPQEQARYLLNAVHTGLTGPDYVRAVACADVKAPALTASPDQCLALPLAPDHYRLVLARAGRAGVSAINYVIGLVEADLQRRALRPASQASFEMIDGLTHIGTALHRLLPVAEATGVVPDELAYTLVRLDRVLDRLLPP
jgi:hypothetical protein